MKSGSLPGCSLIDAVIKTMACSPLTVWRIFLRAQAASSDRQFRQNREGFVLDDLLDSRDEGLKTRIQQRLFNRVGIRQFPQIEHRVEPPHDTRVAALELPSVFRQQRLDIIEQGDKLWKLAGVELHRCGH